MNDITYYENLIHQKDIEIAEYFFVVDKVALFVIGDWVARDGRGVGDLWKMQQRGARGWFRSMAIPRQWAGDMGKAGPRGNCRRSDGLRAIG